MAVENTRVSIIIPVYNKWELTEACLRSLAANLNNIECQVIVLDNASSDQTGQACPAMGAALWGQNFVYRRSECNLNFGPASNWGAQLSNGEFLLFLNNDTIAQGNWLPPLLHDFTLYPNLAASGPLLCYQQEGPLGPRIQHMGVAVNHLMRVKHLYEGLSAYSALAGKRRFFQIITAACMLMPKNLFTEQGGFDQEYKNGLEDVDLCARLWRVGYRMTVCPEARMTHLAGCSPGRHDNEECNNQLYAEKVVPLLVPDEHIHWRNDGFKAELTPWLLVAPVLPQERLHKLDGLSLPPKPELACRILCDLLSEYPLWYAGYAKLAILLEAAGDAASGHAVRFSLAQLCPTPEHLSALLQSARTLNLNDSVLYAQTGLQRYDMPFARYLEIARHNYDWLADLAVQDLAEQYKSWLDQPESFGRRLNSLKALCN